MNKHFLKLLFRLAVLFSCTLPLVATPEVSNVRVSQRAGTNLVDVYYNLSGGGEGGSTVTVELSDNGGASYGLPISSLSGDSGTGVANGNNRHLVWDAGTDRPDSFSETMRLRLGAVDSPPVGGEFALIPAGSFQMGDSFSEGNSTEQPVHTVSVSAFYMARYETTHARWLEVANWANANGYDIPFGGGKGSNHPVHSVSWYDTVKWCNARSQKEGLTPCYTVGGAVFKTGENSSVSCNFSAGGYRLPTEAEWEKAARGGLSNKRFPWGDMITHSRANYSAYGTDYGNQSGDVGYHPNYQDGFFFPYSAPVGSFAPNGYGLYDMAGNMLERCWDWLGRSYGSSPASDPRGPSSGRFRMIRGGSWATGPHDSALGCRVAARGSSNPTIRSENNIGFRLARSSVPQ